MSLYANSIFLVAVSSVLLSVGCTSPSQPSGANLTTSQSTGDAADVESDKPKDTVAVEPESPVTTNGDTQPMSESTVKITAPESAEHGLPAVEISLDTGENYMTATKFPESGAYLRLSGPPGGPLGMNFSHVSDSQSDASTLPALAQKLYKNRLSDTSHESELSIAGGKWPAYSCTVGELQARAHHLLFLVSFPTSKDKLLVDFWQWAGKSETPTPEAIITDDAFADMFKSLSIDVQ